MTILETRNILSFSLPRIEPRLFSRLFLFAEIFYGGIFLRDLSTSSGGLSFRSSRFVTLRGGEKLYARVFEKKFTLSFVLIGGEKF